jgi:hypothetical protein
MLNQSFLSLAQLNEETAQVVLARQGRFVLLAGSA